MVWIRIYNYFETHRKVLWASLGVITLLLAALISTLKFSENISDFLPLGSKDSEALSVYQNISGADKIICLFTNPDDADLTVEAIGEFAAIVEEKDTEGWCDGLVTSYDVDRIREVMEFTYDNIPYFLMEDDYSRMDSLLSQPGYITGKMRQNRSALMYPSGDLAKTAISRDPLGLFGPLMGELAGNSGQNVFETYDGCVFTPDMSRAIVTLDSPFGNSETSNNSKLVALLRGAADAVEAGYPGVEVHLTGGPVIAVGNSSRIKKDTVIAVSLSVVLIVLLLVLSFSSVRNILLILLSIGWGWLFAVGGMSLFSGRVSIIVIGISSVILGIAVNYPLHLVAHISHCRDIRSAVRDIAAPLVVGNITTVGAFLALVPLQSVALRDLGIFASLLLVGTIAFVLVYLPHMAGTDDGMKAPRGRLIPLLADFKPEDHRGIVIAVLLLTVVFGFFSTRTSFNSDLSDINYMTSRQRSDMDYFNSLLASGDTQGARTLYVVSSGASFDEALEADAESQAVVDSLVGAGTVISSGNVRPFLCSGKEQERRLGMWRGFAGKFRSLYLDEFRQAASEAGFKREAFASFESVISGDYAAGPQDIGYFDVLVSGPCASKVTTIDDRCYVVNELKVEPGNVDKARRNFTNCFDIQELDNALADSLSSNFNYIGWACSLIVFFFLWFSFGSLELALISFLPMAVSWVWILGLMSLLGIQFNIVNIILATFIFGQGDDYTIFMAEGCQYEYARGKPIMASYKSSIIQSALIMFIGIGTLIVARHPAMRSLAEVTIIGMFSVVLMAYLIPPFLFRWMTTKNGKVRSYPITLRSLLFGIPRDPAGRVMGRYIYKGHGICREVRKNLAKASFDRPAPDDGYVIEDPGYGETAILAAYLHPESRVTAHMKDAEHMEIAVLSAEGFVNNIEFINIAEL